MFDWNEEELTNIIWVEAGETDDHIVSYQEGSENCLSKKEWSKETAAIKPIEQKTPGDKFDLHRRKLEGGSDLNANGGIANSIFSMDLWPELSLSSAEKTNHDSMASEVSDNLVGITECSSKNGKEQGDFVDYSWAKIGSFDDLDRILSNDDPIFGSLSLGNADELWSSSKEATNCPGNFFPTIMDSPSLALGALKSTSENLEVKRKYKQEDNLSITLSYGNLDGSTSHGPQNVEFPGDRSKSECEETNPETGGETSALKSHLAAEKDLTPNELADKEYRQNKLLKFKNKTENMGQAKLVQNLYDSRIPSGNPLTKCEKNLATSVVKSSPSSVVSSNFCKILENDLSGKIEKLRRRQQMRALLAIKKQQQQFTHKVPSTNHSIFENSSQENRFQLAEDVEDLSLLASFDPNSPLEKNDSNMVAVAIDDHSVEDSTLSATRYNCKVLQLDIRTRLCIRDSLFRLAQSAMQRHYASYTSSTSIISKGETRVSKEEVKNHNKMSETETETNPIDRTVAHLLFLRPLILSRKHPETPESLASTKLPCEHKTVSKVPSPLLDCKHLEQFKNSPFVDASENASNNHPADAEVEASHRNLELF
ncbi:Agglutinin-like protein ALA1, putative isoform 1 [Hibiscus syriacus]|uniref:Agglutinin-like protein ALA1, putative isoform 1 n=1 Tax=Hibiscus syriacus TaxID=106335 RepID=A0A6A3B9K5_HIBSY|nr:Agglutinin-like protein ALA1, putative isoform 1 [Hibiscus syriacus]